MMRKPIRLCRCEHPFRQHDRLTSNPVQCRCSAMNCSCRNVVRVAEEKNFNATTDEVEQYMLAFGRKGVPIREAGDGTGEGPSWRLQKGI